MRDRINPTRDLVWNCWSVRTPHWRCAAFSHRLLATSAGGLRGALVIMAVLLFIDAGDEPQVKRRGRDEPMGLAAADHCGRCRTARCCLDDRVDVYADIVSAIEISAPIKKIDENLLLREQLGALLGSAVLLATPDMTDDELKARAVSNISNERPVFKLANRTSKLENGGYTRAVHVEITSPLFVRASFPFEISATSILVDEIEKRLPLDG